MNRQTLRLKEQPTLNSLKGKYTHLLDIMSKTTVDSLKEELFNLGIDDLNVSQIITNLEGELDNAIKPTLKNEYCSVSIELGETPDAIIKLWLIFKTNKQDIPFFSTSDFRLVVLSQAEKL